MVPSENIRHFFAACLARKSQVLTMLNSDLIIFAINTSALTQIGHLPRACEDNHQGSRSVRLCGGDIEISDPSRKFSNEIFPQCLMLGHHYVLLMKLLLWLLTSLSKLANLNILAPAQLSQSLWTRPHSLLLVSLFHPSPLYLTTSSDAWMTFLQPVEI